MAVTLWAVISAQGAVAQGTPAESDFEKVTLDDNTQNPMELDIAPDGRVFYIERSGQVRVIKRDGSVVTAGSIPVYTGFENGLLGITLDPGFATNGHVWLFYSMPGQAEQHVSRFTMNGDSLDLASEKIVLRIPHQRTSSNHSAGSMYFGPTGDLFISTGDDTACCATGYNPIDERLGRSPWDAQKSSSNTNDLRGKLLRITPNADGSGYTIPVGNLFAPGTEKTRPEIYAMGFRNPFRFTVDPETGWVLLADYGPDATQPDPNRGPAGHVEQNLIKQAGNYGWPYCIADNKPYRDYDFATGISGPPFDCAAPKNDSPNNTGLVDLPPVVPANIWYSYGDPPEPIFDALPGGGAPMGGPRYHRGASPDSHAFPEYYDGKWFIYEWNTNYIKSLDFDAEGVPRNIEAFMPTTSFKRPMDMDFGPDGAMYLIEWGTGFGGNNDDSAIYRIEYAKDLRPPRISAADAQPREGLAPLEVRFSAQASDPDGSEVTYAWEFGDGATSSEASPTHTYTTNGNYTAKLTVTDAQGDTAVRNFPIAVGNTAPKVRLELPPEGAIADFGEDIPYRVVIEDAEDGVIDCTKAVVQVYLGHDEHAHPLSEYTPDANCGGVVHTEVAAGHGEDANIFPVVEARYTDTGAEGLEPATGRDLHRLQPRRTQAEFYSATGRAGSSNAGGGDPGVKASPSNDAGSKTIGYIDDADWISFDAVNLSGIESVTFRLAQRFEGMWIEVRLDAPDGPLVGRTSVLPKTNGYGDFREKTLPITPPEGTHDLFFVFRDPTSQRDLANLNWIQFNDAPEGNSRPEVTIELPEDGAFADAGDEVRYRVAATDSEDGPVDCADITIGAYAGTARAEQQADASCEGLLKLPDQVAALMHVEARHTDAGGLVGRDGVVLHPKRKQAERWERTGRTADSTAGNTPGVQNVNSNDPAGGGGQAVGYVDDGDWVSYGPMSLTRIDAIRYRVAVPADGVRIEVRSGSPTGELVSESPVPATGGFGTYTEVTVPLEATGGSRELFFVFRGPQGGVDLMNVNWIEFDGRGASDNSAPRLTASAKPTEGLAPLPVAFTAAATDPDGDALTYKWDFGVPGAPAADSADASYTYTEPGKYTATVTVTDARGASRSQSFPIKVSGECADPKPADPGYISLFDGTSASFAKWRQAGAGGYDLAHCMITTDSGYGILWYTGRQFADFELKFEMRTNVLNANSSIMLRNPHLGTDFNLGHHVQVLDNPGGSEPNKTGAIYGFRQADKITPKPGVWRELRIQAVGRTYAVFIDGEKVNEWVETDGRTSDPIKAAARNGVRPLMGYIGLENHDAISRIDFRDIMVKDLGGPQPGCDLSDAFPGTALDTERWDSIVRDDPTGYRVGNGRLAIDTGPGVLTQNTNSAPPNLLLQDAPEGDWTIETTVTAPVAERFQQGGLLVYTSDDHYVKLDVVADNTPGADRKRRIELFAEQRAQTTSQSLDVAADAGDTWHLRLTKTGDVYRGEASQDGTTWTPVGELPAPQLPAAKVGLFAIAEQAQGRKTLTFENFRVTPDPTCAGGHRPTVQGAAGVREGTSLWVRFWAAGQDADGGPLTYAWDFGDGTTGAGRNTRHQYEPGTYSATVTVTDRDGNKASAEVDVNVLPAPPGAPANDQGAAGPTFRTAQ